MRVLMAIHAGMAVQVWLRGVRALAIQGVRNQMYQELKEGVIFGGMDLWCSRL